MSLFSNKIKGLFSQPVNWHAGPLTRRIVLGLAFFSLFMIVLSAEFISDKVPLQVGQVSDRDVIAPRSVSYVNAIKTRKLEEEVLANVASVYDFDVTVAAKAEETVTTIFSLAKGVVADSTLVTLEQKATKLQAGLPVPLPASALNSLVSLDTAALVSSEEYTKSTLRKYFQRGVRDDGFDTDRKNIVLDTEQLGLGKNAEASVAGIAQVLLKPNFIMNVRETDKRKQVALANVEPVRETVKKGEVLVRRGDVVSEEQIHVMEELGLHRGDINEIRIFGLAVFVLLVMAFVLGFLYKFHQEILQSDLKMVLLGLIMVVTLLVGKAAHYYSDFAAPLATGALLTAILIDSKVGMIVNVAVAMMFGIIADHELRAVVLTMLSGMTGVYSVSKMKNGYSLAKTGIYLAVMNFIVIGATGLLEQVNPPQILMQGLHGILGGIVAAIITIGLLPYLEHAFNITTSYKLLELANPGHPLLQRLLLEAPGTYHHSLLVGNLAETAADLIGADPASVRVGAYYHDVGKIKRPFFFAENQSEGENPHDKIAPSLSTLIITSHIKDGIDLCREYKLPQIVIDVIQQHHGTMLVSYFYKRATENEHSECIVEADFRYEGPRPQKKEAALVMLADACEAAVRSLSRPNVNRIEVTVRKLIRQRLNDGQLDECDLTFRDLNVIGDVYTRVLSSMFHHRIEYPDALKELERRRTKNGSSSKQYAGKEADNSSNGKNSDGSSE
ncbi:MAG: receptor with intracellular metal dependent phosphohydrolase [Firmicutes bacterium]|nr:receptor with intracellular metal dependent phosphohydrolase [Bacillota bacterium]